jgi:hypothetical protein
MHLPVGRRFIFNNPQIPLIINNFSLDCVEKVRLFVQDVNSFLVYTCKPIKVCRKLNICTPLSSKPFENAKFAHGLSTLALSSAVSAVGCIEATRQPGYPDEYFDSSFYSLPKILHALRINM